MTDTDRSIIVAMATFDEATCPTIASAMGVCRQTINRNLPTLERMGLVRSRWEPQASRIGALVYRLTGRGRALAETIRDARLTPSAGAVS